MTLSHYKTLFLLLFLSVATLLNANTNEQTPLVTPEELDVEALLRLVQKYGFKDITKTRFFAATALSKATKESNREQRFKILRSLGYALENHNQLDSAKVYYEKALLTAEQQSNTSNILQIYTDLGIIHRRIGNYEQCKHFHTQALDLAQVHNHQERIEISYHGLGTLYQDIGAYDKAISNYLKSIALTENRKDWNNAAVTMQYLAETYAKAGDVQQALTTIDEALEIHQKQQDSLMIGTTLFNYGKIYNLVEQYHKALESFKVSLAIFEDVQHKPLIARSLFYIADSYTNLGEYSKSIDYFNQCSQLQAYISFQSKADLYNKLGKLYTEEKEWELAKTSYLKANEVAQKYRFKQHAYESSIGLHKIYLQDKQHETSLQHLMLANQYRDSLMTQEKARQIAEMDFKYNTAKKEKELQVLQMRQSRILFYGITAILLALLVFLLYFFREKSRNNEMLRKKNLEIETQNIKLRESNEVLKQFAYVAAHDLKEPLRTIASFINLIKRRHGSEFSENANEYMNFAIQGVKRMKNLLEDLLQYSTITTQQATNERVTIEEVIQEVEANLNEVIQKKSAVIVYDDNMPNIQMNRLHITQLFQNLISNGLKFTETRPIIKIKGQTKADEIIYCIQDNGIGMQEEFAHKVYNLFHQLHKNKNYEGTGIGLTICKNIVDKYNGKIWFESILGKGTTFYLSFPVE